MLFERLVIWILTSESNIKIFTQQIVLKKIFTLHSIQIPWPKKENVITKGKTISFILGISALTLSIGLVYVIVNTYVKSANESAPRSSYGEQYIPRYSLSGESQWVLDLTVVCINNMEW